MKRIGVLTSGGDTPGMNACIRTVYKVGTNLGYNVMSIYHGFSGLMQGNIRQMMAGDVENMVHKGGTVLRTARSELFKTDEGIAKAVKVLEAYQIDGLVVIGGDGSFNGAKKLNEAGIATIGIPGTIDNDLGYTDFTIGFDTAVNNVTSEIYKIRDTMRSHDRVGVIEVMGRACGDIALYAGIAGGVDLILLPEIELSWSEACDRLIANKLKGKLTSMVLIAEGAGKAQEFASFVRSNSDIDIKGIVLGYIQRGGNPSANDRIIAARMGQRAVELLHEGQGGRAVGIRDNQIIDMNIGEALGMTRVFPKELYELNDILSKS